MNAQTQKIRGVSATIRAAGFTWRAVAKHLGGAGTDYARFNGRWEVCVSDQLVRAGVYRPLRAALNRNISIALGA